MSFDGGACLPALGGCLPASAKKPCQVKGGLVCGHAVGNTSSLMGLSMPVFYGDIHSPLLGYYDEGGTSLLLCNDNPYAVL